MDIIILGGGVIGTTTAYYLAKAGAKVTVIDRQSDVAMETSFAMPDKSPLVTQPLGLPPKSPKRRSDGSCKSTLPLPSRLMAQAFNWHG